MSSAAVFFQNKKDNITTITKHSSNPRTQEVDDYVVIENEGEEGERREEHEQNNRTHKKLRDLMA